MYIVDILNKWKTAMSICAYRIEYDAKTETMLIDKDIISFLYFRKWNNQEQGEHTFISILLADFTV